MAWATHELEAWATADESWFTEPLEPLPLPESPTACTHYLCVRNNTSCVNMLFIKDGYVPAITVCSLQDRYIDF
jgi:hypothetical protein